MTKKIYSLLIFIITLSSCAQNKTEEITTDSNGNVIERKEITNEKEVVKTSEEILEDFYKNQNDIKSLDKLISFRLYQKTPYVKFKETMETKNKVCGKLIEKKIVEKEFSEDKKAIKYKIFVNYEKKKTIEQIVMIKETENSNFQIFDYNIKTN
jgi:hypothetical protein